jgi:hypothetical protein
MVAAPLVRWLPPPGACVRVAVVEVRWSRSRWMGSRTHAYGGVERGDEKGRKRGKDHPLSRLAPFRTFPTP